MQRQGHNEDLQSSSQLDLSQDDDDAASRFDFDVTKIFGDDNTIEPEVRQICLSFPALHILVFNGTGANCSALRIKRLGACVTNSSRTLHVTILLTNVRQE